MSTFGLTWNLKSPDRNKQYFSNISRTCKSMIFYQYQKHYPTKCFIISFSFLYQWHSLIFGYHRIIFHVSCLHIHDICLTSVTIQICGQVHPVQYNHIKQVRETVLSGLGIKFQNLNLLHFDQIIGLKSLSIYLFILAWLNLGLEMDRLPVQASPEALCSEREKEREKPV